MRKREREAPICVVCQFNSFQLANSHNLDADDGNTYGFVVVAVHLVSANGSIVSNADLTWECVLPIQSEKTKSCHKLRQLAAVTCTNAHKLTPDSNRFGRK